MKSCHVSTLFTLLTFLSAIKIRINKLGNIEVTHNEYVLNFTNRRCNRWIYLFNHKPIYYKWCWALFLHVLFNFICFFPFLLFHVFYFLSILSFYLFFLYLFSLFRISMLYFKSSFVSATIAMSFVISHFHYPSFSMFFFFFASFIVMSGTSMNSRTIAVAIAFFTLSLIIFLLFLPISLAVCSLTLFLCSYYSFSCSLCL